MSSTTELKFINESEDYESREKLRESLRNIPADKVPAVQVPFPPDVNPKDLIRRDPSGILRARATNKFLIYRSQYAKALKAKGYCISMRTVSALASKSWQKEPRKVQRKYEELAKEVAKIREEISTVSSTELTSERRENPFELARFNPSNIINTNNPNLINLNHQIEYGNNNAGFPCEYQAQQFLPQCNNYPFSYDIIRNCLNPLDPFIESTTVQQPIFSPEHQVEVSCLPNEQYVYWNVMSVNQNLGSFYNTTQYS
ncbi:3328_t:CDS:2 [Ambispora gerdemannii]|uniref:3328_t:CDS:1 n=1 Tax=Ambispora gerdemannii TaxID=144530 RepID=A0A9N9CHR1_9GLOM|nr:3328_t:CDS:2 [Ambispora gerdemannii]